MHGFSHLYTQFWKYTGNVPSQTIPIISKDVSPFYNTDSFLNHRHRANSAYSKQDEAMVSPRTPQEGEGRYTKKQSIPMDFAFQYLILLFLMWFPFYLFGLYSFTVFKTFLKYFYNLGKVLIY